MSPPLKADKAQGVPAESGKARCLLALDSAGAACSVALWCEGEIRARRFEVMTRGQSERLVPMVEAVMAEAGVAYEALDAIAVTRGPGGFTGVRIGLATARALALACARPVIGVSNFEAVAAAVPEAERRGRTLAVLIDAKRRDLYAQAFTAELAAIAAPRAIAPEALHGYLPPGALILAGDAVAPGRAALQAVGRDLRVASCDGFADAARVAMLAAARPLPAPGAAPPRPLYLRGPDVSPPAGRPAAQEEPL
jgi:tRNA threonylcarbamoyladenosine biosynthesis protein TsaB